MATKDSARSFGGLAEVSRGHIRFGTSRAEGPNRHLEARLKDLLSLGCINFHLFMKPFFQLGRVKSAKVMAICNNR